MTMHRIMRTLRIALLGAAAVAPVVTAHGQSILGPPGEANHFIATPKGWIHPKTPWGEPDIQANLNMMQAAGIPLERCANATRFGGSTDHRRCSRQEIAALRWDGPGNSFA